MPSTAFNYEIVEKVAVLSQSGDTTKELNRVSYNGSPVSYTHLTLPTTSRV